MYNNNIIIIYIKSIWIIMHNKISHSNLINLKNDD
jgi:hypothetical protein